jgi:hypothetical protein
MPPLPRSAPKAPVIERFGLQGYGAHSADAEYVLSTRSSRACILLARMIMDISQGNSPSVSRKEMSFDLICDMRSIYGKVARSLYGSMFR